MTKLSTSGIILLITLLLVVTSCESTYPISSETLGTLAIPVLMHQSGRGFMEAGKLSGKILAGSLHYTKINLSPPPEKYLPDYTYLKGPHVKDGHPDNLHFNPSYPSTVKEVPNPQLKPLPWVYPRLLTPEIHLEEAFSVVNVGKLLRSLYPFLPSSPR